MANLDKKGIENVLKETKQLLAWLDEDMHGMMSWVEEVKGELETIDEEFSHKDTDESAEYDFDGAVESLLDWCESLRGSHGIDVSSRAWTEAIEELAKKLQTMFKNRKAASMDNKRIATELVKLAKTMTAADSHKRFFWFGNDKLLRLSVTHYVEANERTAYTLGQALKDEGDAVYLELSKAIKKVHGILSSIKWNIMKDTTLIDRDAIAVTGICDIQLRDSSTNWSKSNNTNVSLGEYAQDIFDMLAADGWHR